MLIRAVDLETTGVEPADHVVEIAAWDLIPENGPVGILNAGSWLVKPPIPIPPAMSAIHHLIDADVSEAPAWADAYPHIIKAGVNAYCAHNAKFERQWITDEITGGKPWVCTYRCALRVWTNAPSHSNQALRYWLNLDVDRGIASYSHRAGPDAYVTVHLLRELLKHASVEQLIEWSSQPALLPRVTFGKHRGAEWKDIPRDYLEWLCRQPDMNEDVKFTAKHYLGAWQ